MAAELAVVCDVGVAKEEVVAADSCRGMFVSSAMDGTVFAEGVSVANFESCWFSFVFEVLGFFADSSEGEKLVVSADFRWALDYYMGVEDAAFSKFDVVANDGVGADADIWTEVGRR